MTLVSIEYEGVRFKACSGRKKTFVEARSDVAKVIVAACLDRTATTLLNTTNKIMTRKPNEGCQPKGDADGEGCKPTDPNNIGFKVAKSTYEVTYIADDGTKKRTVKGLKVPSSDQKGRPLGPDVYDENLRRIYRVAQAMWNELDRSEEPRFVLE